MSNSVSLPLFSVDFDLSSLSDDISFEIFSYCNLRDLSKLAQVNSRFSTKVNKYAKCLIKKINFTSSHIKMHPEKIRRFQMKLNGSSLGTVYNIYQSLIDQKTSVIMLDDDAILIRKESALDIPFGLQGFKDLYEKNRSRRCGKYLRSLEFRENYLFNSCMKSVQCDVEKFLKESVRYFNPDYLLKYAVYENFWEVIPALVKAGARLSDQEKFELIDGSKMGLEWIEAYDRSMSQEERFFQYTEVLSQYLGPKVVNHCLKKANGKKKKFVKKLMKCADASLILRASAEADYKKPVSKLVQAGARFSVEGKGVEKKWIRAYERACCEAESEAPLPR